MEEQIGGIPWVLILIGVVILGLVLAYGVMRNRSKLSPRQKHEQVNAQRENIDKERVR